MRKPVIVVNFKTYNQGKKVLELAKKIEKIDKNVIIGVQVSDVYEVVSKTKLKVYAQHVDCFEPGRYTGFIIPEAIKAKGAEGVFLNHSEHRLKFSIIKKSVSRCKKIKLKTMVFVKDLRQAKRIKNLKPDYIIFEPPELVAGSISVSKAKPELIEKISRKLGTDFLVGAGIKTREDVEKSLELGSVGVAVSSAVTKAKNPEKIIKDLCLK